MSNAATVDEIESALTALIASRRNGVTEPEATKAYCHCNTSGCDRCEKQTLAGHAEVARRHAEMYPAIAAAEDALRFTSNPAKAIADLEARIAKSNAQLLDAVAKLSKQVSQVSGK